MHFPCAGFAYPLRMNLLPFGKLPAHKPRKFVPSAIDLGDWPQIAPLFDQLEKRAAQCQSAADLERWLLDWSELSAALDEEAARRYIAMTCHTDNADAEKAYLHFVETSSQNSSRASSSLKPFASRIRCARNYSRFGGASYTSPKRTAVMGLAELAPPNPLKRDMRFSTAM